MSMEKLTLRVIEAKPRDVGRGIARIDSRMMERMNLSIGEAIAIEGKKRTAAKLWPGSPEDEGKEIIRLDGNTRRNAGVGLDDRVVIYRIDAKPAQTVTFAPTQPLQIFMGAEEYLVQLLTDRIVTRGDVIEIQMMSNRIELVVTAAQPGDTVIINMNTQINLSREPVKEIAPVERITYEDIGGLRDEIRKIREMVELPMKHPELFTRLGIEPPKGVLLYGPPGTGKTLLAKAVANETNANFFSISGPEIMSKFYGESEQNLRNVFKQAEESAPSIIFIDEIDSIAPKRDEVQGEVERRVVAQLLSLMDGLQSRGKVIVIGATNRPNSIDPALRRPGRFDREIEIGIPDKNGRLEILTIHARGMPLEEGMNMEEMAQVTHGFTGADLAALSKEAAMHALRRVLPEMDLNAPQIPAEVINKLIVTRKDFMDALTEMEPSALREVFVEVPNVRWEDVGGLKEVKRELMESIEWPLKYPDLFEYAGARPPKGILLYGPPGAGKTLLAKAVATECETNFISVKGPEIMSKWVGESEKAVREIFRKARQAAPCIVFLDELDSITPRRDSGSDSNVTERIVGQLLTELDGVSALNNVIVIGATNRPDIIDTALLRAGRFDRIVNIPLPDAEARKEIFQIYLKKKPLAKDVRIDEMVKATDGYTGADIEELCRRASMLAIREFIAKGNGKERLASLKVEKKHFDEAMKMSKAVPREDVEKSKAISNEFSRRMGIETI
jgi:transitional endoplasmic reticulum ATPase